MNDDTITRARAAVARLREVAETARTFGAIFTVEGPTALSLLALAEACALWATPTIDDLPWWCDLYDSFLPNCKGCGSSGPTIGVAPPEIGAAMIVHDADCPALAIDAALADLAALAGDADAGEVG